MLEKPDLSSEIEENKNIITEYLENSPNYVSRAYNDALLTWE